MHLSSLKDHHDRLPSRLIFAKDGGEFDDKLPHYHLAQINLYLQRIADIAIADVLNYERDKANGNLNPGKSAGP
jgi:hypothetical protein